MSTQKDIIKKFSKAQDSLVIQQADFSLSTIANMVMNDSIDISPRYQRRDKWKVDKQSALIESFLMNVPVPPVYLSEDDYGVYSVIDGKQRITSVYDFLQDKFKLKNLKEFPELDGLKFSELPPQLQNVLSVRPFIRVITLLKQSNPELKYEVFLRLNTGGEKLKPQEVRNVAYSGPVNDLLFELSENNFLKYKLKIQSEKSTAYRNMDDIEHVLRFLTLSERWETMGGVLADEMDKFMRDHRYDDPDQFKSKFEESISRCEIIWGDCAFQKWNGNGQGSWREQLISPLYDAQMVSASLLSQSALDSLSGRSSEICSRLIELFENDEEFVKSISQSTNNPSSIKRRISTLFDLLNGMA